MYQLIIDNRIVTIFACQEHLARYVDMIHADNYRVNYIK